MNTTELVVENKNWKKFMARTGFEPMTSSIPVHLGPSYTNEYESDLRISEHYLISTEIKA